MLRAEAGHDIFLDELSEGEGGDGPPSSSESVNSQFAAGFFQGRASMAQQVERAEAHATASHRMLLALTTQLEALNPSQTMIL